MKERKKERKITERKKERISLKIEIKEERKDGKTVGNRENINKMIKVEPMYIKCRCDVNNTQKTSECILHGDKDETVNYISVCNKQAND